MSGAPLILRLVASSVCISHRAGRIIRDIMKKGELGIVEKGKMDFQTEADRSAQKCILSSLHQNFPKVTVFGEEGNLENPGDICKDWIETSLAEEVLAHAGKVPADIAAAKDDEICVWVDPLDGTAEYTQGLLDHVTVLIGIAWKGKSVAGVIYQPYYNYEAGPDAKLGRVIWGMEGVGAFGYDNNEIPDGRIITTTRSHGTKQVVEAIEACEPSEIIRAGGAGHKVLLILEGKAHCYLFASPGCKKWDTCAPEAVLHAAGGKLTDIHGNFYQYGPTVQRRNLGGTLATPIADAHEWYLNRIPQDLKDMLPAC